MNIEATEKEKFEKWCSKNHIYLWKIRLEAFFISGFGKLCFFLFTITLFFLLFRYVNNLSSGERIEWFLIGTMLIMLLTIFINKKMSSISGFSDIESIVLLINKISDEIQTVNDESKHHKKINGFLKNLYAFTQFEIKYTTEDLFKDQIKRQKMFFKELRELPLRLHHAIKNNNTSKININLLTEVSYNLKNDKHDEFMRSLHTFSKDYTDILPFGFSISKIISQVKNNKIIIFISIVTPLVIVGGVFWYFGILSKDTIASVLASIIASLILVIFQPRK